MRAAIVVKPPPLVLYDPPARTVRRRIGRGKVVENRLKKIRPILIARRRAVYRRQ
jgi:hypothetical protein